VGYDISSLKRAKFKILTTSRQQLKENLFLPLFIDLPINYRFDNMRGKARDILILYRITDFSTTGSARLKRRSNGRNLNRLQNMLLIGYLNQLKRKNIVSCYK